MPANPNLRGKFKTFGQMASGAIIVVLAGLLIRFLMQKAPPAGWMTIHPPRDVNALAYYQGQIWSGGKDGLYLIDPETGNLLEKIESESGQDFSFTTSLVVIPDSKQIWVGHQRGLSLLAGEVWTHYGEEDGLPESQILALLHQAGKGLWIATAGGLAILDEETGQINPVESKLARGAFSVLYLDSEGVLYAGNGYSKEGGLLIFDGKEWGEITPEDGLAHPMVNAILGTRDGKLYFGTGFSNQGGLSIRNEDEWISLAKADGLAGNKVRYLFQDQKDVLWVGSEFEGIAFQGLQWTVLTPEDGLAGWEVKAMLQDQAGRLWFGTENGLTRLDKSTWLDLISSGTPLPSN